MQKEIWKNMLLFNKTTQKYVDTVYAVSNTGRIKNRHNNRFKKTVVSNGYNCVDIWINNKKKIYRIDAIVAKYYLQKYNKPSRVICHIDGNTKNDNANNLKWMSTNSMVSRQFPNETWKPIDFPGKPNYYYISNKGSVWSIFMKKKVSQRINSSYYTVRLGTGKNAKSYYVHRLVAIAFCDNSQGKRYVNHKDLDKLNNDSNNLEWVTNAENSIHSMKNQTYKTGPRQVISVAPKNVKSVVGFPNYVITNDGRIYSVKSKIYITQRDGPNGYKRVRLHKDGKKYNRYVHCLMAETYVLKPNDGRTYQVHHIDLNRTNNNLSNIKWITRSESIQIRNKHVDFSHRQKRVKQLDINSKNLIKLFPSIREASRQTGVSTGSIVCVCKGTTHTAGGYKWEYA